MNFARALGFLAAPLALALGGCDATGPARSASAAAASADERHVTIATPDGTADALLFTPAGTRPAPAVILWADVGGLRPAIGQIGRKLAAEGYVVLAPNAFYRSVKLDGTTVSDVDGRTRFTEWRGATTKAAISRDARAYLTFLDGLKQVNHAAKAGTVGYDAGAAYAFFTAQALPERVAAVAIFHPTGTATARDNSPHLFVKESRAAYYVALSADDDKREPEDKAQYRDEFAKAGLTGTVVVLAGNHGFALPDNPAYDAAVDAQSWAAALALLKSALH
jgi:carboxymethylenebutenolidase